MHTDRTADFSTNGDESVEDRSALARTSEHIDEAHDAELVTEEGNIAHSYRAIVDLRTTRSEQYFATITERTLTLWSTRPVLALAAITRSRQSLEIYGVNKAVLFRPDASTVVIHTSNSYLVTYSVGSDPGTRVYQQHYANSQSRRQGALRSFGANDSGGVTEVILKFRRAIKIDAGINAVLALDQELVVATQKPAAAQCIKWEQQKDQPQAVAQLLSKMDWLENKTPIRAMVHDRAMNLSVWLADDGYGYAVQRTRPQLARSQSSSESFPSSTSSATAATRLFEGYCFHQPSKPDQYASLVSINARFSLIAVATKNGRILCYTAKDYVGNISLSHILQAPVTPVSTGAITTLTWSPDGYCLFAGYEKGWATWSVFGREGASSFNTNASHAQSNRENWLLGTRAATWIGGGSELLLTCLEDDRIWKLEISRSAAVGCFSCANLVRALLQTPTEITIYRGHEMPDLTSISNEASLWHHAQYPAAYLHNNWPIRACVASQDGKYVAVAGRRGIAHYSVQSGRWKTFADVEVESSFAVRGGMCWINHILAAASEHGGGYDLRLYSRDLDLGRHPLHAEAFSMPIVFVGPSGEDSLLVYTYENILYHYVISFTTRGAQLVQVGQIAFHGVVRAPSRVRSVSWVVPDLQLRNGDPSRDVEFASVMFLVDDKLVLLQPSRTPENTLKYDMKVIAHHVEYYILMRDQIYFNFASAGDESMPPTPATPSGSTSFGANRSHAHYSLRDSLWIFSGTELRMWPDVRDVLHHAAEGDLAGGAPLLSMPVDFYPLSILLTKGVVLGIESELLQRRDVNFAQHKSAIRTQLFIPYVLRHQLLAAHDTAAAFGLANQYQHLSYFPHALEILLHHVLDDEVDRRKSRKGKVTANDDKQDPLPAVLSFLQMVLSPTTYLSTVVQCIRKTELTSWQTLFAHLPPPLALFEQALELEDLKTATGYLIVLQGLEEEQEHDVLDTRKFEQHVVRLMRLANQKGDYELCSELARFMMGIDPRGNALRRVIQAVGFTGKSTYLQPDGSSLGLTIPQEPRSKQGTSQRRPGSAASSAVSSASGGGDYFSASPGA